MKKLLLFLVLLSNSGQIFTAEKKAAEYEPPAKLQRTDDGGAEIVKTQPAAVTTTWRQQPSSTVYYPSRMPHTMYNLGMPPIMYYSGMPLPMYYPSGMPLPMCYPSGMPVPNMYLYDPEMLLLMGNPNVVGHQPVVSAPAAVSSPAAPAAVSSPVAAIPAPVAAMASVGRAKRSKEIRSFNYLQKTDDGTYICLHPTCGGREIHSKVVNIDKNARRDSALKHEKDHIARDLKSFRCEKKGCGQVFARNGERNNHYKRMHPENKPAAEEISSGPSPVNVLSGELVEESDSDDRFDDESNLKEAIRNVVGKKAKFYTCIYRYCPHYGEEFSKEGIISHCKENHGMQGEDIELEEFRSTR
jgi:hypothetical protein